MKKRISLLVVGSMAVVVLLGVIIKPRLDLPPIHD
jgi:hypothetical protein